MHKATTQRKSLLAGEDQSVSFAELFFDLIFVFSITQVVHILDGHFDWVYVGRAILVFWLVWWAWTQFTWALNAADTKQNRVLVSVLVATGIAFFMAVSVPQSFSDHAWLFAASYVAVRSIGLLIYVWVTWVHPQMRSAVRLFGLLSIAGLVSAVAGGILGGEAQYWLWGLTIVLDVLAATVGGKNEGWNLHPKHFTERHGLFVIIALGETLIVAASAAAGESWETNLMIVSALAIGITSVLWWIYFYRLKDRLEHAMANSIGAAQSTMGRDVYSLFHFPMLCGLIIYAYAIEEAMLHPDAGFTTGGRVALALGISLFSLSLVLAYWRATGKVLFIRIGATLLIAGVCVGLTSIGVITTMAICFGGLVVMCFFEARTKFSV